MNIPSFIEESISHPFEEEWCAVFNFFRADIFIFATRTAFSFINLPFLFANFRKIVILCDMMGLLLILISEN